MALSKTIEKKIQKKTSELTDTQKQKAADYKKKVDQSDAKKEKNFKDVSSRLSGKTVKTFGLENTTSATGLEKAIFLAGDGLIKAQQAVDDVFYGKFEGVDPNIQNKLKKSIKKALDQGLINTFSKLSEIDLCNVLNYSINKIPGSEKFDPEKKPASGSLAIAKYEVQKKAYDVQKKIDGYYSSYIDTENEESKAKAVYSIINEIKDAFRETTDETAQSALRDPRLTSSFPQLNSVNDTLGSFISDFNNYTDFRQIPSPKIQQYVKEIDRVRQILILVQGLSKPADAISFADSVFPNANIAEQVNKLEALIPHDQLSKFLSNIVKSLEKLQSICNVFSSFIAFGQTIITIMILIVKALKIIVKFIKALPIPLVFVVSGVVTTLDDVLQNTVIKFLDKVIQVLNQINVLLSLCIAVVTEVSSGLYYITSVINSMLNNLKGCTNIDEQLISDLEKQRDNLLNTANGFEDFTKNYENNKIKNNNTFGDYTIQIVTEEIVDNSIKLRRRYGIAQAINGTIAAKSQPTYASDDQVIINEVKQQLSALGYVKNIDLPTFSAEEVSAINESLKFLLDDTISFNELDNLQFENGLDKGDNEDENKGIGLNAFVNKLQGGKKLRSRMRGLLKQNSLQLKTDLANSGGKANFNTANLPQ